MIHAHANRFGVRNQADCRPTLSIPTTTPPYLRRSWANLTTNLHDLIFPWFSWKNIMYSTTHWTQPSKTRLSWFEIGNCKTWVFLFDTTMKHNAMPTTLSTTVLLFTFCVSLYTRQPTCYNESFDDKTNWYFFATTSITWLSHLPCV